MVFPDLKSPDFPPASRGFFLTMSTVSPVRIQRSRQHKQVSPNRLPIVYVGRPSKWGNPFKVGTIINDPISGDKIKTLRNIDDVLHWYKNYLRYRNIDLAELKGKNLSCWCKVGEPCHADILLEIANRN